MYSIENDPSRRASAPDQVPLTENSPRELLWLFPKHGNARLTTNFSLREFRCGCDHAECFSTLVHPRLVDTLQTLREMLGWPVRLTSAFRCRAHNAHVGGRSRSFHLQGMAADIACASLAQIEEVLEAARRIPAVGGLGTYAQEACVHLDVRRRAPGAPILEWSE